MARTPAELLEQLDRMLPLFFAGLDPRVGIPATLSDAEERAEVLQPLATIEGADGKWLSLQARGQGVQRGSGEADETLRTRMRYIEDSLTKPAIKAAVDAIIAPDECQIVEWGDGPYLGIEDDTGAWLGNQSAMLSMTPRSFSVIIPIQDGIGFQDGGYLGDDMWLGSMYVGEAPEPPVYSAIINQVNRMRAAGVYWRLVLATES